MDSNNLYNNTEEQQDELDIMEILFLSLANWKWIVLSLLICLSAGTLLYLKRPPVYQRMAQVLVKIDSKNSQMPSDIGSMFSSMGLGNSGITVTNEVYTISSPATVMAVVKKLGMNVSYYSKGMFHDNLLYGTALPANVEFLDLGDNMSTSFNINLKEGDNFTIDKLISTKGKEIEGTVSGHMGDTLSTPIGRIIVSKNNLYRHITDEEEEKADIKTIIVRRSSISATTKGALARLTVERPDEKSSIIDMTFNDISIQRAEDFLNMLITVHNENWIIDKNQIAVSTSAFITDRLEVIEKELGIVDEDISSFKSANLIPDVQAVSKMYMDQAQKTEANLIELNNEVYMAKHIRNYLGNTSNKYQLLPANSGLTNTAITTQINDYNKMLLQRNTLVANSSETNPLVVDIDKSLEALRSAILTSIDNELVTLDTRMASLSKYGKQATNRMASNPDQAKYLLNIERQQAVKEALYLFLLQKREENELSQAFTAYNTRIISPPYGSNAPIQPNRIKFLALAFLLGLAIPVGCIVLIMMLDNKIKGRKDLEGKLTLPFLGEIPEYEKTAKKNSNVDNLGIVIETGNHNYINEAFRVLRTNIEFVMKGEKNVAAISSYSAGSGKTFIINNIAGVFAIKDKKVLIIDCDIRKATTSKIYGNPKEGLTNYLNGDGKLDDLIVKLEDNHGVDLLPCGPLPPNPSELLSEEKFDEMIEALRKEYDYIFIDCPPIDIVADTAIVNRAVDHTFFVVRAGLLEKSMVPHIEEDYRNNRMKSMSLILNGTDASGKYGGRYSYKYGYNYGYGKNYYSNKK